MINKDEEMLQALEKAKKEPYEEVEGKQEILKELERKTAIVQTHIFYSLVGRLSQAMILKEIHDKKLYKAKYETFELFCQDNLNRGRQSVYDDIKIANALTKDFVAISDKIGFSFRILRSISRLSQNEWNEYFYGHWNFSGEKQDKHLAPFPEELPKRLIKMFSFAGDTILDPFLGSGTTSIAALKLSRNSIGYEVNIEYLATIKKRLMKNIGIFERDDRVEVIKQDVAFSVPYLVSQVFEFFL